MMGAISLGLGTRVTVWNLPSLLAPGTLLLWLPYTLLGLAIGRWIGTTARR